MMKYTLDDPPCFCCPTPTVLLLDATFGRNPNKQDPLSHLVIWLPCMAGCYCSQLQGLPRQLQSLTAVCPGSASTPECPRLVSHQPLRGWKISLHSVSTRPLFLRTLSPSSPSAEVTEEAGSPGRAGHQVFPCVADCYWMAQSGLSQAGPQGRCGPGCFFSSPSSASFFFPRQGGRPMASGGIACVASLIYGASLSHRIPSPCRPRWRRGPEAPDSQEQSGGLSLSEEHSAAKESSCSPVQANFTATKPLMRYIPASCMCVSEADALAYLWVCSQVFILLPPC